MRSEAMRTALALELGAEPHPLAGRRAAADEDPPARGDRDVAGGGADRDAARARVGPAEDDAVGAGDGEVAALGGHCAIACGEVGEQDRLAGEGDRGGAGPAHVGRHRQPAPGVGGEVAVPGGDGGVDRDVAGRLEPEVAGPGPVERHGDGDVARHLSIGGRRGGDRDVGAAVEGGLERDAADHERAARQRAAGAVGDQDVLRIEQPARGRHLRRRPDRQRHPAGGLDEAAGPARRERAVDLGEPVGPGDDPAAPGGAVGRELGAGVDPDRRGPAERAAAVRIAADPDRAAGRAAARRDPGRARDVHPGAGGDDVAALGRHPRRRACPRSGRGRRRARRARSARPCRSRCRRG